MTNSSRVTDRRSLVEIFLVVDEEDPSAASTEQLDEEIEVDNIT